MYHGKITKSRKKRKYATGGIPSETTIGDERRKKVRSKGGGLKVKLMSGKYANIVLDTGAERCEIVSLVKNPANKDFSRRNIITKGAVIKAITPKKKEIKARVTSRPGQDGVINAIGL